MANRYHAISAAITAALLFASSPAAAQEEDGDEGGQDDGSFDDGAGDQSGGTTDDDPYDEGGGGESSDGTTDDDPEPGTEEGSAEDVPTGPEEGTGADFEPGQGAPPKERPPAKDGVELPPAEPYLPNLDDRAEYDDAALKDALDEIPDGRPFAKGSMEPGIILGGYGSGEEFSFAVGASFAYYVINGLAPGLQIQYSGVSSDLYDYPHSFEVMPFLKWVFYRGQKFCPYAIIQGGRDFQWGGSTNPLKGVRETDAWVLGGGGGMYIKVWGPFGINIQLMVLYYWYDGTKVFGLPDDTYDQVNSDGDRVTYLDDNLDPCDPSAPTCDEWRKEDDRKDEDGKVFFPIITIGPSFVF